MAPPPKHSWKSAPELTFVIGTPEAVKLAQFVKNPQHVPLVYSLVPGYAHPSGVYFDGDGNVVVRFTGSGVGGRTDVRYHATNTRDGYAAASPLTPIRIVPAAGTQRALSAARGSYTLSGSAGFLSEDT